MGSPANPGRFIFALADRMCFAEMLIDLEKRSFEILWDATDKPTSDFQLEDDADLKK